MRRLLQIIAVSTGGLSILASLILGIIYLGDITQGTKNIITKLKTYIEKAH